jgi:heme-degrading monooxygenase HmoA
MIARVWRGIAVPETVDTYLEHLQGSVLPELSQIDGFCGAYVLRRDVEAGVEVTVQTLWVSIEAIRQFAGEQVTTAVVASAAQPLFRSYDALVTHYEIVLHAEQKGQ